MSYRDRVLADGSDRDAWKVARFPVIGASDAKVLAKPSSVNLYLAAKLKREVFTGNAFTDNGYRWEPIVLGWAGYEHNQALYHAADEPGFAATPDGIRDLGGGIIALAECKVKHVTLNKRVTKPTLGELRQIAWQFRVFPEALWIDWCWVEVDKDGDPDNLIDDEPRSIRFNRGDPTLTDLLSKIEPIAADLLSRLRAALAFEMELAI